MPVPVFVVNQPRFDAKRCSDVGRCGSPPVRAADGVRLFHPGSGWLISRCRCASLRRR